MANKQHAPRPQGGTSGTSIGKLLIALTVLCGLAFFAYKKWGGTDWRNYTSIPEEMQITYMPSDFSAELDEDKVLKIMSNPGRYQRDFNDMVYELNMKILTHVSTRMNLPDSLSRSLEVEYRKHHSYLKSLYFKDIIELRDTSAATYEQWYANDAKKAVDALNEVASKYTCFLVNQVMLNLINSQNGMIAGKGTKVETPCAIAMTEALRPMIGRLQERAAIYDFSRSKGLMEERVESVIAELATMEVRDKKAMTKELKTKLLGYSVSSTEIEISAISIMKVGFKLDDYFDIGVSSKSRTVTVTLPEPKILSHEVYPKVDKLDVGWLRELGKTDFNKNFNALRAEFRRDANESEIFGEAKKQAEELMKAMVGPMIQGINGKYKLKVRFKKRSSTFDDSFDADLDKISPRAYDKDDKKEDRKIEEPMKPRKTTSIPDVRPIEKPKDREIEMNNQPKPSPRPAKNTTPEEEEETPAEYVPY